MIIQGIRTKEASNVNGKIFDIQDLNNIKDNFNSHPVYSKYYTSILDIENLPFISSNLFGWNLSFDYDINKIPGNFFYPIGKKLIIYSPVPWSEQYFYNLLVNASMNQEIAIKQLEKEKYIYNDSINSISSELILRGPTYMMKSCEYKRYFKEGEDTKCQLLKSNEDLYEWKIHMFNQDLFDVISLHTIQ